MDSLPIPFSKRRVKKEPECRWSFHWFGLEMMRETPTNCNDVVENRAELMTANMREDIKLDVFPTLGHVSELFEGYLHGLAQQLSLDGGEESMEQHLL